LAAYTKGVAEYGADHDVMIVTIFVLKLQELFLPFVTSPLNRGRFQSPFAWEDFGVRLRPELQPELKPMDSG
jgi:hypothetical protein